MLVHGASADSTVLSLLTPLLEPHYTVHAMDRRGRGHSGDATAYDIGLEYADVAAVVDHGRGGQRSGSVPLRPLLRRRLRPRRGAAHPRTSSSCSSTNPVTAPSCPPSRRFSTGSTTSSPPERTTPRSSTSTARAVGMSADDVAAMRRQPSWHARLATVPTISRELRTVAGLEFDPAPYRNIDTPAVLLLGDRSTPGQKAVVAAVHDALPQSTVVPLPGQAHAAQITAPDLVANAVIGHRPATTPA